VLPGTKATVADLKWLRDKGLADAITAHVRAGRPLLAICGGFQMLGSRIVDQIESNAGEVAGLGLLDLDFDFTSDKTLANPAGIVFGVSGTGYEIHHGRVTRRGTGLSGLITLPDGAPEGALAGPVAGTHWHGLLENDEVRRAVLRWAAGLADRDFQPGNVSFAQQRAEQLDVVGDLVDQYLDTDAVLELLAKGAPAGLSGLLPGAAR